MNKELTPNPKCSNCKCYWKPDETDIKSSGLFFKTCRKCRERQQETRNSIQNYKNEEVHCECGTTYKRNCLLKHLRSKTHSTYNKHHF